MAVHFSYFFITVKNKVYCLTFFPPRTLKTSWSEVISQTENCGQSHIDISIRLLDEAKKVEEFRETQKERRRKEEECIKKLITAKKDQYNKVVHVSPHFYCSQRADMKQTVKESL